MPRTAGVWCADMAAVVVNPAAEMSLVHAVDDWNGAARSTQSGTISRVRFTFRTVQARGTLVAVTPRVARSGRLPVLFVMALAGCHARQRVDASSGEPIPVRALPRGHALIIAFPTSSSEIVAQDPDAVGAWQWTALDSLTPTGFAREAWWRPSRDRVFVRMACNEMLLVSVDRVGHLERVLALDPSALRADHLDGGCLLAADASALVCHGHTPLTDRTPPGFSLGMRIMPLDHAVAPRTVRWTVPLDEQGPIALSNDFQRVYFAERCPQADHGLHCVFSAPLTDGARTLAATVGGDVCSIDVSPDGVSLAIVSRGPSYIDPCSELTVVRSGLAPTHTSLVKDDRRAGNYHGISSVAFSPDGTQLAVSSDHAEGCVGSQGISSCAAREYVVDLSTMAFRAAGSVSHEAASIVWLPR